MAKLLSFCTTCRNRFWQIKETLPKNLEALDDKYEIVLVDYGSTDGLSEWVWSNLEDYIKSKKLVLFEIDNEVRWNLARAKNLAHRLATGEYLFNLDADNYLTPLCVNFIEKAKALNLHCWQWSGTVGDGSSGRIGIPKEKFIEIGGYDETLLPMGAQDIDIIRRLNTFQKILRIPAPTRPAIQNSFKHRVNELMQPGASEVEAKETYGIVNSINLMISKFKPETEGPIRAGGGFSYRGRLNGVRVIINGFNEIRRTDD